MPIVKFNIDGETHETREYHQVRILPSGWVKTAKENGETEHYPPQEVYRVEDDSENVYYGRR